MGNTFDRIKELVSKKEIKISAHGYDEMAEDNIFVKDVIADVFNGIIIEIMTNTPKTGVCLFLKETGTTSRYMLYGVFPGEHHLLL